MFKDIVWVERNLNNSHNDRKKKKKGGVQKTIAAGTWTER